MKVLMFAGNGGSGGLKGYIKGFLSAMNVVPNVQLCVICTTQFAESLYPYRQQNIDVKPFYGASLHIKDLILHKPLDKEILRFVEEYKPDLVYYTINTIYKELKQYPSVIELHNQLYVDKKKLMQFGINKTFISLLIQRHYTLKSLKVADATIFDSNQSMEQCDKFKVEYKKGIVAYFGVDNEERGTLIKKKFVEPIQMIYISTLFPYKNQVPLLKGLRCLKNRGYEFLLHLVGSGPKKWEDELRKTVVDLSLQDNVEIHGWVEHSQIQKMIDDSDIFLYASSIETSGFGLMEGMVRGAVIACNNESCMPEILQDGGLLFDVYNSDDVADKLEMLISDPKLRIDLAQRALKISSQYTWENHVSYIFQQLEEILN